MFTVDANDIKNDIYVPRYYWTKKIKNLEEDAEKQNLEFVSVKELIDKGIIKKFRGHGAPPSEFKGRGEVPYVRAGDIVSWEIYKNPMASVPIEVYKAVKGNGVELKPKDIVFVKEGSYRIGSVALLSKFDTGILLNHHSLVFRVVKEDNEYGIDAFYLLYLFSHELTQRQLFNKVMIDTTLPNIGDRWQELRLPVAKNKKDSDQIKAKIKSAFEKRWEAQEELNTIKPSETEIEV
jgi:type I restriction enzyme M protein